MKSGIKITTVDIRKASIHHAQTAELQLVLSDNSCSKMKNTPHCVGSRWKILMSEQNYARYFDNFKSELVISENEQFPNAFC